MSSTTASLAAGAPPRDRIEYAGVAGLLGFAAALQVSIAVADILLAFTLACWAAFVLVHDVRVEVPRFFWPLAVYATLTLVSASFSPDPRVSFIDSKQLVLFLIVPMVLQFAQGTRAMTVVKVVVWVGALSAILGIAQYGILHYNNLGQRPQGTLGHYMTYSGLLVLVIAAAVSRMLFYDRDRAWLAVVMPALVVALVLTFTRSAWVGACVSVGLLLSIKDFRLLTVIPVTVVIFLVAAPSALSARFYSIFDAKDATSRDRVAMLREGVSMVRARPLTGVGPDMVVHVYDKYRDPEAVQRVNPHLHNVPMQIAAERGLPALAAWIAFVLLATVDLIRLTRRSRLRCLPIAGLAAIAGMLSAGLFEYNFGDSEFLMLFLVLITLPFAAERPDLA